MKLVKKNGAKVFWVTTGVALGALILLLAVFNVVMIRHINSQARQALNANAAWLRGENNYDIDLYDLFVVNFLYLDKDNNPFDAGIDYYYDPLGVTNDLLTYQAQHKESLLSEEPCAVTLGGQNYYVRQVSLPERADYEVSYDEEGHAEESFDSIASALLYVNVTPWSRLWSGVNLAFAVAVLLFSAAACGIGLRTGMMIEDSEERMKRFFQNASHELKTPITSIQGYAEGIATGVMLDAKAAAGVILEESERMRQLVEDLLYLSRIDSGRAAPRMEKVDLRELIYGGMATVSGMAMQKGVSLEANLHEAELPLMADERQLSQAIGNILANGVRYARSRVTVSVRVENCSASVIIADDGSGITPGDLPHIFERFYYGKHGGTGIGMALAQEIAVLHRGSLCAQNSPEGAVFTLTVPLPGP
ncbi:sensor histidine kinase [Bacillota bacterium Meth-B3]